MAVLLVAEHRNGKLLDATFETLALARKVTGGGADKVHAVLLGKGVEALATELSAWGCTVHHVDAPALEHAVPGAYAKGIAGIVEKVKPTLVLLGHSTVGYDVAPRLAAKHGWPLVTNVVRVEGQEAGAKVFRSAYGGRVHAEMKLEGAPALLTLQPGAFAGAKDKQPGGKVEKGEVQVAEADTRQKVTGFVKPETGDVDIAQSDIVIAVGRGLKEKENLKVAEELAKTLGGVIAGSRPLIDMGWLPHDRQVGVSGKTVKAKLYIALGISGQVQHISGMKGCEFIVAVNKDANAPIFKVAHVGVTGDLFKVVPALVKALQG